MRSEDSASDELPRARLSRRRFLRLSGLAGTLALAGLASVGAGSMAGAERKRRIERATFARTVPASGAASQAATISNVGPSEAFGLSNNGLLGAYANPIVAENCPDPHVFWQDGVFYMVSTTGRLPAFPIRRSTDLIHWERTGAFVFTATNKPRWAAGRGFWAPELHAVDGLYVIYFNALSRETHRLCIGAAVAASPDGPYTDLGRPLVSRDVNVLDATFFRDDDGRQYLYWKADAGIGDPGGPICVRELKANGLEFAGPEQHLTWNDLDWEGPLIEGPSVMKRQGLYYLFYSGGRFNKPDYAVGVARSTSPVSGFVKYGAPILRGNARWRGPGHNSIISAHGRDYIVYHAWEGDEFRDVRSGLIDPIVWSEDGWPSIKDGVPSDLGGAIAS